MKHLLVVVILFLSFQSHAEDVRAVKVKVSPDEAHATSMGICLDNVCYNPNHPSGTAYTNCMNDGNVLNIMSNNEIHFNWICEYASQCGPFYNTYRLKTTAFVH